MSRVDFPHVVLQPRYRYFLRAKTATLDPIDSAYLIKLATRVLPLLVFLAFAAVYIVKAYRSNVAAITTNGRITRIELAVDNDHLAQSVSFEFTLPDGETITRSEMIDVGPAYQEGQEILVTYAPDDLTITAIDLRPLTSLDQIWVAVILAILSSLYLGYHLWKVVRHALQSRQLAQRGIFIPGSIIDATVSSTGHNSLLHVDYAFTSPNQKEIAGRTTVPYTPDTTPPPAGTPLVVLYVNDGFYKVL